jgi:hypothetical protein
MKRVLRLVFSTAILTGLAISQVPSPASCQMLYGSFLAKSCSMPCCKTEMPVSKCPMLKMASAPRDIITASVPTFENTLQPLHLMGFTLQPASDRIMGLVASLTETIRILFSSPPKTSRAPPSDIHLINA